MNLTRIHRVIALRQAWVEAPHGQRRETNLAYTQAWAALKPAEQQLCYALWSEANPVHKGWPSA